MPSEIKMMYIPHSKACNDTDWPSAVFPEITNVPEVAITEYSRRFPLLPDQLLIPKLFAAVPQ